MDSYSPQKGATVTSTVTLKNQGSGSAGSSTVKYYIDDSYVASDSVPSLSAGSTSTQTFTWTADTCGNVQVKAVADANNAVSESASWNGYGEGWDTLTFESSFTLEAGKTYNYVIKTGSYPQIHHTHALQTENGWLNCTKFVDANGKRV